MVLPASRAVRGRRHYPSAKRARHPSERRAGCIRSLFAGTCAQAAERWIDGSAALAQHSTPAAEPTGTKAEEAWSFSPVITNGLHFAVTFVVHFDRLTVDAGESSAQSTDVVGEEFRLTRAVIAVLGIAV